MTTKQERILELNKEVKDIKEHITNILAEGGSISPFKLALVLDAFDIVIAKAQERESLREEKQNTSTNIKEHLREIKEKEWNDFVMRFKSNVADEASITMGFYGQKYVMGIDPNMGIYLKKKGGEVYGIYSSTIEALNAVKELYFKD